MLRPFLLDARYFVLKRRSFVFPPEVLWPESSLGILQRKKVRWGDLILFQMPTVYHSLLQVHTLLEIKNWLTRISQSVPLAKMF